MSDLRTLVTQAAVELSDAAATVDPLQLAALIDAIAAARRIVLHGLGREGLMMRALAMRLYHAGLDAHVLGDMSCPPVGAGDLFLISAGPGDFATILGLVQVAKRAGARVACVTAVPQAPVPAACDQLLVIPAQTMATDQTPSGSILPMGSLFEGAMFLVFEVLILMLSARLGISPATMRDRHTNLE